MRSPLFALEAVSLGVLLTASCALSWSVFPLGDFPWHRWHPVWFPSGLVAVAIYFLPTIIAAARHKRNMLGIVLLNVFLGWTLVGWVVALIWSLR